MSHRALIPVECSAPLPLPAGAVACELSGPTMGTSWSVRAMLPPGLAVASVEHAMHEVLARVIAQMSTWQDDSLLSRLNCAEAGSWHALPDDFMTVLDAALTMAADSAGAFDPSVGPLVNLWGFGPDVARSADFATVPAADQLAATRLRCGWQRIELDREQKRILQPGGLYLDFSGIAKGYAVDLMAQRLQALGCQSWLVEIGGELRGQGIKADQQPWWVAVERPPQDGAAQSMVVALHDLSIATSGDYRRYFERDGRRYAHTIDPRDGMPVAHALASVTVLHRQCMVADALATVLTVLGPQEGMAFARARNIAALFIEGGAKGFSESMTPAMAAMLD